MEFNENFIEVEAGDITKKWQSIYAYNGSYDPGAHRWIKARRKKSPVHDVSEGRRKIIQKGVSNFGGYHRQGPSSFRCFCSECHSW